MEKDRNDRTDNIARRGRGVGVLSTGSPPASSRAVLCGFLEAELDPIAFAAGKISRALCGLPAERGSEVLESRPLCRYHSLLVVAGLLTSDDVSTLLRVSRLTLAKWEHAGKLTPVRTPGGRRRYKRADVTRVLRLFEGGVA